MIGFWLRVLKNYLVDNNIVVIANKDNQLVIDDILQPGQMLIFDTNLLLWNIVMEIGKMIFKNSLFQFWLPDSIEWIRYSTQEIRIETKINTRCQNSNSEGNQ